MAFLLDNRAVGEEGEILRGVDEVFEWDGYENVGSEIRSRHCRYMPFRERMVEASSHISSTLLAGRV